MHNTFSGKVNTWGVKYSLLSISFVNITYKVTMILIKKVKLGFFFDKSPYEIISSNTSFLVKIQYV